MKTRLVKKIIALAAGVSLVGTTLAGAFAYDLAKYPSGVIVNGVYDGKIVVGENAAVPDVLGAIEIAAELQKDSKVTTPSSTAASLGGDVSGLYGGKLQLRSKPVTTLHGSSLKAFKTGTVTNGKGSTDYREYIRFGFTGYSNITVNYVENDDDQLKDFMVLNDAAHFLEWEMQFSDGFESDRDSDGSLSDFEDKTIGLMGADASIVDASIDADGTDLELTFMSGTVADTLREGETKTYTFDGTDYEVTLVFVSDPNSGGNTEVKFSVNGELTKAMEAGETDVVADNVQMGVRDILVNSREGVASFYLGARKVVIADPTPLTENFDGTVEVDDESITNGDFQVVGTFESANSTYRIKWMKYQYGVDPSDGSTVFLPKEKSLRDVIDDPYGFLSDFDIHYEGLLPMDRKDAFKITADGDDQYVISMVSYESKPYSFPFLSNKDGVWKFGNEDDDLVFVECSNFTDYNVGMDDYFVMSQSKAAIDLDKSATHVFRYVDYDSTNMLVEFESQSDKSIIRVPLSQDGIGYLIPWAHTYKFNVSNVSANAPGLSMDLDASGTCTGAVRLFDTWGSVIINPAEAIYLNGSLNATYTNTTLMKAINGNGKTISGYTGFVADDGFVKMSATVMSKKFESPGSNETFYWTITQEDDNEVNLDMAASDYDGPLNTDTSDANYGFIFQSLDDDEDHTKGMTDYGILIDLFDNEPGEITLNIPTSQQYGQVFATVGAVDHTKAAPGIDKINPIAVGFALLDKDALALIGKSNLIVVGGPCANTVAAELLGNPAECGAGFVPGEAIIQAFEKDGKVALLVAGYGETETQGASMALASYGKYKLSGEKTTLVVPDLSKIEVKKAE